MTHKPALAAIFAAGLLSACASTPSGAGTASGDLVLRATGAGTWSVDCAATNDRGRPASSDMSQTGGRSTDVIALRRITEATCAYQTGDAPVQLTLEEEGLNCPFGTYDMGVCRTVLPAESAGTLDFTPA